MNNTLIKGLQVVELLAHSDTPQSLTDIANRLGLAKSNVHRLLIALSELKYVIRDESSGRYNASIKLWELGSAVLGKLDLKRHAEHWMSTLKDQTGETVHLSVLDRDEVVYVHKIESDNPIRAYTQIGGRVPAYCVATGKAMLAYRSAETLQRVTASLVQITPATIAQPKRFLQEIEKIRKQGYAVNRGEWREGVYGVAAPILDGSGQVIAALGLSGPSTRFRATQIKQFAEKLGRATEGITQSLGGHAALPTLAHVTRRMVAAKP
ncbi:IclR family transcriptional regulator [Bordetella trematum]|uniref:IclR family transcriptional regulator n=1 Tax=Bordetella trematum TaxID=123899 RepID=UPI000D879AF4|nr:IclR family transcriptional regulator [Bordetella trematum]SPU49450.1 transcriptional regulator [Bordetella trematum]VDH08376.1 Transcriptional regulator kdgR [Bordetella trematum]